MQREPNIADLTALTIAGFDPSSGAGVTADLAVFAAHGIFGTSAVTALTIQSTIGVRRSESVSAELLADTLACLQDDLPPHGVKIGMLGGARQVRVVANYLRLLRTGAQSVIVVLDPVLRSSSGAELLDQEGTVLLLEELLPLVDVVTPNSQELGVLTGTACEDASQIAVAAHVLVTRYPGLTVLATGGDQPNPDDLLLHGAVENLLHGERVETSATHGTGCALSSALLCQLLRANSMIDAAGAAKRYVEQALRSAIPRGGGRGPMNLLWPISKHHDH